ncbi:MAG: hypothetical protein ACP5M4_12055 [Acidobacteriaceae bacterium]
MRRKLLTKTLTASLAVAMLAPFAFAARNQADETPIAWGTINQNTGCVIFEQHRATRGMFWGVAATVTRYSVLQVVESHNYTLPRKNYKEDQATLNKLQDLAARNQVKFINIPGKVTQKKLKEARQMCRAQAAPQYDAASGSTSTSKPGN